MAERAVVTTLALPVLTKKDFQTDQEIRWCPGCGDYAILAAVQAVFPRTRHQTRKFRRRLRYRLLLALPVLHEHRSASTPFMAALPQ
jgi:hypothetical protein